MNFDPAVAGREAFERAQEAFELGGDLEAAVDAEEVYSSSAGEDALAAYRELLAIGERNPESSNFLEYLVYATWSHLMDGPSPEHFKRGLALCRHLLMMDLGDDERTERLRAIEQSFRAGLGEKTEEGLDFGADTLKGGD